LPRLPFHATGRPPRESRRREPRPTRESRRYQGPGEISKERSDGDTGPATLDPRRASLLAAPQPLRLRHAACRFTTVHTFAWKEAAVWGQSFPATWARVRPRSPPAAARQETIRSIHTPGALPALAPPPALLSLSPATSPLPVR